MPRDDWKGVVNQILYGLIFTRDLDDDAASRMADAMVERRHFGAGPGVYAAAIVRARRHRGPLTDEMPTPHGEEGFRAFLELLAAELDARRPWRRTTS
ncbi:hypothetical protein [Micromonospora coxensis]|uniref:Tetracycline repressor TetR C-terminal domain-containing protein n=1 Tax=Micromonospora coxensis TaxID=356852 RepID=A0A1C5JBG8_9ACTN|nr:hypothetical protein [Micromonospora coxensis]SCG67621.1 hypothetical protein GA0070614_4271 [Micromonospora coxensis]